MQKDSFVTVILAFLQQLCRSAADLTCMEQRGGRDMSEAEWVLVSDPDVCCITECRAQDIAARLLLASVISALCEFSTCDIPHSAL